jgi:ribosomal protein L29
MNLKKLDWAEKEEQVAGEHARFAHDGELADERKEEEHALHPLRFAARTDEVDEVGRVVEVR